MSQGSAPYGPSHGSSGDTTPLLRVPSPPPTAYLPARVLDVNHRQKLVVDHVNMRCWHLLAYVNGMYHTLVNCRLWRFYSLFAIIYLSMYATFAALYASQLGCISNVTTYWHAFWFSVHSSATIGYGQQAPDPDCIVVQVGITAQVLVSLFMQGSLLGLVFARISNSSGRSTTIRFSKVLSMYLGDDGLYRLAFRVANLRQHQVLQPEVHLLLLRRQQGHPFSSDGVGWEYVYTELVAEHVGGGRLWLGVPSLIEHRVDQHSPLFGMHEGDLRASDNEFIVLLDGVDEATSRSIQARHSYVPSDIRWQHRFDPCLQRRRSGKMGIDFSRFDSTAPRSGSATPRSLSAVHSKSSSASFAAVAAAAVQQQHQQLHQHQQNGGSRGGASSWLASGTTAASPSALGPHRTTTFGSFVAAAGESPFEVVTVAWSGANGPPGSGAT